jgi:hypothetical protein
LGRKNGTFSAGKLNSYQGAASHLGKTGLPQIQSGSWRPTILRIAGLIPLVLAAVFFWPGKRDSQQQTRQIAPPELDQQA